MRASWLLFRRLDSALATNGVLIGWLIMAYCVVRARTGVAADREEPTCPMEEKCVSLSADCLNCTFPASCQYGESLVIQCAPKPRYGKCQGEKSFRKNGECLFCYQTDPRWHICDPVTECDVTAPPPDHLVRTTCYVNGSVFCMGRRQFPKRVPCRWTSGRYKWSTALMLSITLGGFGVDRFYLGLWRSGLGKLFSFGGLGVWTIVDVVLIAVGYIGPGDSSLYMY